MPSPEPKTLEKQAPKKTWNRNGGRKKGVPNKLTTDLRTAILMAATQAGGKEGLVGYLQTQAVLTPGPFLGLLSKVLPNVITGANGGPVQVENTHIIEVSQWSPQRRAALRSLLLEATLDQKHIESRPGLAGAVTYARERFGEEADPSDQEP